MSDGRYELVRQTQARDAMGNRQVGLELDVRDAFTGKPRSASSLSGGEAFQASLALALGLSDVVQAHAGGVRLDTMFVDEGFGTLSERSLALAVRTLTELSGSNKLVGIISHVEELRESIGDQQAAFVVQQRQVETLEGAERSLRERTKRSRALFVAVAALAVVLLVLVVLLATGVIGR